MTAKVAFRGGLTCSCMATVLPLIEEEFLLRGVISNGLDIWQLGWRNDVGASAGTHGRGGVVDLGQFTDEALRIARWWGLELQRRTRGQGFDIDHGHGVLKGCDHLSPAAAAQAADWERGRNGLMSHGSITGPGPKGQDTPTWQKAIRDRKAVIVALKNDIADEVVRQLRKDYPEIADAVLARDGVENTLTGNAANKTISAKTALAYLGRKVGTIVDRQKATDVKLDQVLELLKKEPTS